MKVKRILAAFLMGGLILNLVSCGLPAAMGRTVKNTVNAAGKATNNIMTNGF
jgi:thiol:disulfide interchange protein